MSLEKIIASFCSHRLHEREQSGNSATHMDSNCSRCSQCSQQKSLPASKMVICNNCEHLVPSNNGYREAYCCERGVDASQLDRYTFRHCEEFSKLIN
jgi:hypothetical protein